MLQLQSREVREILQTKMDFIPKSIKEKKKTY